MKSLINIPEKMKALVLYGVGDLRVTEVDVPKLEKGTVLLKIKACGICSSDMPRCFVTGTYHFPTIPGHEFSGQIVACLRLRTSMCRYYPPFKGRRVC